MKKEYGGYLPLELCQRQERFRLPEGDIRSYNCGRTAIYEAALAMKSQVHKIYVPYYICHTVVHAITQAGIEVARYSLNEKLEPTAEIVADNNCEGVLIVDYFGLKDNFLRKISNKYAHVILDCTQAFFFEPVIREGINNIYSCRKFVGVPEGGYLVEKNTYARQLEPGSSWTQYGFLCKAHELGTNSAYQDSLENERQLGERKEGMSHLTQKVLQGVDYDLIARKRKENFKRMQELLGDINRLAIVECYQGVPQCYPFWAPKAMGQELKEALLKEHIYIPTLWKECREICEEGSLEVEWTNDLLCIPIDQRYSLEDMEFLAVLIKKYMGEVAK